MINKKGYGVMGIFMLMISAFVIVIFFAGWIYGFGLVNDVMSQVGTIPNTNINVSSISDATFGQLNNGYQHLRFISFMMIFGYSLSILITSFLRRKHPGLAFVVYILVTILSVVFSVYLMNEYENLLLNEVLGPTLQTFTASNFFMSNMLTWVIGLSFVGMILLFSGIPRDRDLGGGVF